MSYPNASNEMDLDVFYNELSSLVHSIPKHNVLIISGDMNAQIAIPMLVMKLTSTSSIMSYPNASNEMDLNVFYNELSQS